MARLYANENFPLPVVAALRLLGHDVLTSQESGQAEQAVTDEAVLQFATQDDRSVVTLNRRHFIHLHHQRPHHAGVIVCTVDRDFVGQANRIHLVIESQPDLRGRPIRINRRAD